MLGPMAKNLPINPSSSSKTLLHISEEKPLGVSRFNIKQAQEKDSGRKQPDSGLDKHDPISTSEGSNPHTRNNYNEPLSSNTFYQSTKNQPNYVHNVERMSDTFNFQQQLPPPPALPSEGNPATSINTMLGERQIAESVEYYPEHTSSTLEVLQTSNGYSQASSQIAVLHPSQPSSGNYVSAAIPSSPSQAFITHYPHNMSDNPLVQSHVVHHRPNADIDHFQPHITMPVDGEAGIGHPPGIEMATGDIALQIHQPIYDQSRNIYIYPNTLVDCSETLPMDGNHLGADLPPSNHQVQSKIELSQSDEQFIGSSLQRSLSAGHARRKREQNKMDDLDSDQFDGNQPVPDKTIEDVLKGAPGNEQKKRKIEELLK